MNALNRIRSATSAAASNVVTSAALGRILSGRMGWSGIISLAYHRVGDGSGSLFDRGLWSAEAEQFRSQLRACKAHLDVIGPTDLPDVLRRRRGRYAIVTFDDGYRDNYDVAFQILKAENVPATFFVTTGFVDQPRLPWWDEIAWMVRMSRRRHVELTDWFEEPVAFQEPDREDAIRTLLRKYKVLRAASTSHYLNAIAYATGSGRPDVTAEDLWMSWEMLREMRRAGMTIGGHSVTHPVLARSSDVQQQREIVECSRRLSDELGEPMKYFSYPIGKAHSFNAATRKCLRDAGVQYAFSYYGGIRRFSNWDDYDVRRVAIETDMTPDRLRSMFTLPRLFARAH